MFGRKQTDCFRPVPALEAEGGADCGLLAIEPPCRSPNSARADELHEEPKQIPVDPCCKIPVDAVFAIRQWRPRLPCWLLASRSCCRLETSRYLGETFNANLFTRWQTSATATGEGRAEGALWACETPIIGRADKGNLRFGATTVAGRA